MRERKNHGNFQAKIIYVSKEDLTPVERVKICDTSSCIKFDDVCKVDTVTIDVDWYAVLEVHNDLSTDRTDYENIVVVDKSGERYVTGSESFMGAFEDIYEQLENLNALDQMRVEVYQQESKKRQGKYFITCRLA